MSEGENQEPSDFEKKVEEMKGKFALGLFGAKVFVNSVLLPRVQELSAKVRDKADEILEKLSADSARNGASFEESLRTKRETLLNEGLTAKEADEAIEKLVKRTLKKGSKREEGGNKK